MSPANHCTVAASRELERGRRAQRIDDGVVPACAQRGNHRTRIGGRMTVQWRIELQARRDCPEAGLVGSRKRTVGVGGGQIDHAPDTRQAVEPVEHRDGSGHRERKGLGRTEPVADRRARDLDAGRLPPGGTEVEPFQRLDFLSPVRPPQLGVRRITVRHHAEPAKSRHVFDDIARFASQGVGRWRHPDDGVVTARCADLHAVDDQHSRSVRRRLRHAPAVSVVCENEEVETRASGGRRHIVNRPGAVGAVRVDVERARNRVASRVPGHQPRIRGRRR